MQVEEKVEQGQEANNGQKSAEEIRRAVREQNREAHRKFIASYWKELPQKKIARYARMIVALSLDYEAENDEIVNVGIEGLLEILNGAIKGSLVQMRKARDQK